MRTGGVKCKTVYTRVGFTPHRVVACDDTVDFTRALTLLKLNNLDVDRFTASFTDVFTVVVNGNGFWRQGFTRV